MEVIKVVIQSLEDAANGKPIVKDLTPENVISTKDVTIGILEHGTKQGQTTLMFILKTPDGKHVVGECTANHFEALIGAYKGAQERFNQNKKNESN